MKKILLGLGSVASITAPVAAVISCGDDVVKDPGVKLGQILGEAGTVAGTAIDGTTVKTTVTLKELPDHLSDATIDAIVADIKKSNLANVNDAFTIEVIATKINLASKRATSVTLEQKKYVITMGLSKHVTDAAAVKVAAKLPSALGKVYTPTPVATVNQNAGSTQTQHQDPAPRPVHVAFDFTSDLAKIAETMHSTKTADEMESLDSQPTVEALGVEFTGLTPGLNVLLQLMRGTDGKWAKDENGLFIVTVKLSNAAFDMSTPKDIHVAPATSPSVR